MNAAEIHNACQRQRWMRPDAYRWLRPDAACFLNPGTAPASCFPALDRKFNPSQPRVAARNPDGGQWTDGSVGAVDALGASDDPLVRDILAKAEELRLTASPADYQNCLNLCYRILERSSPRWSHRNTWDFHKCMNACLGINR